MTAGGDGSSPPCPAAYIGMRFVKDYYTMLAKEPENVHKFYKAHSVFSRGADGAGSEDVSAVGPSEIHSEIMACVGNTHGGRACYPEISHVESQESFQGGVLVLVTGYLTFTSTQERQHFTQALVLEPQEQPYNGYFVLNDILRYIPQDVSVGKARVPTAPMPNAQQPTGPVPTTAPRPQSQPQDYYGMTGKDQEHARRPQAPPPQAQAEQQMPILPPPQQPPIRPPQEHLEAEETSPQAASSEGDQQGDEAEASKEIEDAEEEGVEEDAEDDAAAADEAEQCGEAIGAQEEKKAEPQAKSWAERVAASRGGGLPAPPKRGLPPPASAGMPVLPPPTAAAKAEAARAVQRQHAAAAAAAGGSDAASAGSASMPAHPKEAALPGGNSPPGSVRLWLSRLPPEKVADAQELLDTLNGMLAEVGMASGRAMEVDRKEASGKDWGYLVVSSQEVADQMVQFSKEKTIIFQNRSLKAEYIKPTPYTGGGSSDSAQRRRSRGLETTGGSPGSKVEEEKRRFGTDDGGRKGAGRKGKGGGKEGYGEEQGGKHGGWGRKGKGNKGESKGTWRAMTSAPVGGGAGGGGSAA